MLVFKQLVTFLKAHCSIDLLHDTPWQCMFVLSPNCTPPLLAAWKMLLGGMEILAANSACCTTPMLVAANAACCTPHMPNLFSWNHQNWYWHITPPQSLNLVRILKFLWNFDNWYLIVMWKITSKLRKLKKCFLPLTSSLLYSRSKLEGKRLGWK